MCNVQSKLFSHVIEHFLKKTLFIGMARARAINFALLKEKPKGIVQTRLIYQCSMCCHIIELLPQDLFILTFNLKPIYCKRKINTDKTQSQKYLVIFNKLLVVLSYLQSFNYTSTATITIRQLL